MTKNQRKTRKQNSEPVTRAHRGAAASRRKKPVPPSDETLSLLINGVKDYAIFMLDQKGTIRSWNAGAERLTGYRADEVLEKDVSIFYPREDVDRQKPDRELAIALSEGRYEEEGWRIRKTGERFWANVIITPLTDSGGNLRGFAKVTRDITDLRKANEAMRQSEERMRLLIDAVREYAIFMLDPRGHITSWNPGAERIKGYTAREIIGRHFSVFYTAEDRRRAHPEDELRQATANGSYSEEGWRLRKDGTRFWASVVITAVYDGRGALRGFAKVTRDLTERHRMEQEAREAELQAFAERTRTFEAERAVQNRDEFISVAAHELRTPLTALQLKLQVTAQALKRSSGLGEAAAARLEERIAGALRNAERLTELVERLLDVTRIVGGKLMMKPEEVDLVMLARRVVDDLREAAMAAGSEVTFAGPEALIGFWDRARIEQVIINLLSNAIKYGAAKPIHVRVQATGAGARLAITDEGIGISPGDVERIFERFERAVSARHYSGLGLGLYVTRNIVAAHGGAIRASSEPGRGATFTIDLPLQIKPASVREEAPEHAAK